MKQGNHILQIFSGNVRNKGFCLITAFIFSLIGQTLSGKWTTRWKEEMGSASNYSVAAVESRPRAVGTIAVAGTRIDENGIDRAVLDVYDDKNGTGPTILTSIETDHSVGRFANFTALAWSEGGHDLLVAGNYVGGIRIKTDHKVAELTNADEEPTNHAFIAQFSFSGDGLSVNGLTKFKSDQAIALCRDPLDGGGFWFLTGSGKIHKLNLDEKQQVLSVEETISTGLAGTTDLFVGENELAVIGNNKNKGTLKTFTKANSSAAETFSGENNEHFTSLAGDGKGGFYVTGKKGGDERESEERLLVRAFGENNWRVDATGSTRSWGAGISIVGSRIFVAGTFNNQITVGGNELFINEQVDGAILPGVVLVELGKEKGDSIRLQSLDDAISYSNCLDKSGTLLAGSFLNRNGELISCLIKLHEEDPFTPSLDFGLVAYYPFDGNASDMSGNGHHGTVFGATLTDDRNGEHGKAYLFDGRDDFIDLGSNSAFNSFPLTVGVWVKSNGNSGESGIVSKYRAASWNGWQIMEQEDKIVPWYIRSHGQRIIGNYGEPKAFETVLQSPEKWNHLICVFDENGGRIYLNGSLQDTKAWTGDPSAPTASHGLYVGKYQGAGSGFYSGRIDDVRIYDRTLSSEEVTALYELEKPNPTDLRLSYALAKKEALNNVLEILRRFEELKSLFDASHSSTKQKFDYDEEFRQLQLELRAMLKARHAGVLLFSYGESKELASAIGKGSDIFELFEYEKIQIPSESGSDSATNRDGSKETRITIDLKSSSGVLTLWQYIGRTQNDVFTVYHGDELIHDHCYGLVNNMSLRNGRTYTVARGNLTKINEKTDVIPFGENGNDSLVMELVVNESGSTRSQSNWQLRYTIEYEPVEKSLVEDGPTLPLSDFTKSEFLSFIGVVENALRQIEVEIRGFRLYGLELSNDSVEEHKPLGTVVGTFHAKTMPWAYMRVPGVDDEGHSDSPAFSLVEGEGSADNKYFTLSRDGILKTAVILDYNRNKSLNIRVRYTEGPMKIEKSFTIKVLENAIVPPPPPPDPTDYEKKYDEALAHLEALKILDKKVDSDIAQRRVRIAKLDDELSVADKSLQEANVSLAACEKECEGLAANLRAIDGAIGVEDAKIYGLNGKIGASEKQFTDLENDKSKLEEDLAEAERKGSVPHTPGWHFIDGKGWLWTSPDYFPLVYSEQVAGWMYYESGSQTPWLYFDYNTESWQEW